MLEITLSAKHTCQTCGKVNVVTGVPWRPGMMTTPRDALLIALDCDRNTCSTCLSVEEKEEALRSSTVATDGVQPEYGYLRDEDVLPIEREVCV